MERTPLEIWTKIFAHACTDSGSTGRHLSLVSKFFREASASVKLQSISVLGRKQMIAFHQLLLKIPPHLRHIRYLFLSSTPLPSPRSLAPLVPTRMISESAAPNWELYDTLCDAVIGVLVTVADCVEILYLDLPSRNLNRMPITSFPHLAEMTSSGSLLAPMPRNIRVATALDPNYIMPNPVPFPQLRRWHFTTPPLGAWGTMSTIPTIRITAPAITHLRFSGLYQEKSFIDDLKAGLPETIQHVYVKPAGPIRPGGARGGQRLDPRDFTMELERLNRTESRFVLLPDYNADEATERCTIREWEERIDGGDGCWSLRERVFPDKPL